MAWLLIDAKTHEVTAVQETKPQVVGGLYVAETMIGWPKTMIWSPAMRGFVPRTVLQALQDTAPRFQVWNPPTTPEGLLLLKSEVVAELKDQAEQLKMHSLTPGGAKKAEYAAKESEVKDADQLGGLLVSILAVQGAAAARFPQATASMKAFGESSIRPALDRFRGGIGRSVSCPTVAGVEEKIVADVRAAASWATLKTLVVNFKWPA